MGEDVHVGVITIAGAGVGGRISSLFGQAARTVVAHTGSYLISGSRDAISPWTAGLLAHSGA